jgi:RNA polymerase sigma factor (TIGR02999 family)
VQEDITRLLIEWRKGSDAALEALMPLVYGELRRIASRQLAREREGHTLQATALVHEAWMQLAGGAKIDWQGRAHFLAIAARSMRQILVQHARAHNAEKRGSGAPRLELNEAIDTPSGSGTGYSDCDLLTLDHALEKLSANDDRKGRIIEMKYFGGLTNEEIAEVLDISIITVRRDLQVAHAFLHWQMSGGDPATKSSISL